jgi:hypothetical protein
MIDEQASESRMIDYAHTMESTILPRGRFNESCLRMFVDSSGLVGCYSCWQLRGFVRKGSVRKCAKVFVCNVAIVQWLILVWRIDYR